MLPRWYLPTEPPISVAGVSTVSPVAPLHHRVVLPQAMVWHYIVSQCRPDEIDEQERVGGGLDGPHVTARWVGFLSTTSK